ncbi:MAG: anti-sigma factor [Saprospiraceae bacterium]|nr:anti-sigma factor [Saprospiraceae bacterium]
MDVKTYIESGILELYVLGQLTQEEEVEVQQMQSANIEIQREIYEISVGLEKYGQLKAIKAPDSVHSRLFDNLPPKTPSDTATSGKNSDPKPDAGLGWNLLTTLFALISLLGFSLYIIQKSEHKTAVQKYEQSIKACDSISNQQQIQYALLNQINNPNNKIIDMTPTAGYPGIAVYLHHNTIEKKNFLQLISLPTLSEDQAFQLWSLKDGAAPMPLNVFVDRNKIIEVAYIDNTATYAITIEPKGGSKAPSLDKLIGTIGVI